MSLLRRLSRLERIAGPSDIDDVIKRMTLRTIIELRNMTGTLETGLKRDAEIFLQEDCDRLRHADQAAWQIYARTNRIIDIQAIDGRLIIPLATRLQHYQTLL